MFLIFIFSCTSSSCTVHLTSPPYPLPLQKKDAGGGLVFWHPKGATIRRLIEDFWKVNTLTNKFNELHMRLRASPRLLSSSTDDASIGQ